MRDLVEMKFRSGVLTITKADGQWAVRNYSYEFDFE